MQGHAIVAGRGDAQALRREAQTLDGPLFGEFPDRAVGEPDVTDLADRIGDRALWPGRDDGDPFARHVDEFGNAAVMADAQNPAVLAAGDERLVGAVLDAGQQATLMRFPSPSPPPSRRWMLPEAAAKTGMSPRKAAVTT